LTLSALPPPNNSRKRNTERSESIRSKELRGFDAGYHFSPDGGPTRPYRGLGIRVPMLPEVYEEFPDASVSIEIKWTQQGIEEAVLNVVRDAGAEERTLVVSNHNAVVKRFRELSDGQVSTGASTREFKRFCYLSGWRLEWIVRPAYVALKVPVKHEEVTLVTSRFVKAAHARGVRVDVGTINALAEMCCLLNLGVDVIMTDHPDGLAGLLPGGE
jgi:glycerophosphoryl diester phosphodiesterase